VVESKAAFEVLTTVKVDPLFPRAVQAAPETPPMGIASTLKDQLRAYYAPLIQSSPTLTVLHLLARPRMRRTTDFVQDGYESTWGAHREALAAATTLEEWLFIKGIDGRPTVHHIDGKIQRQSFDWNAFQMDRVMDAIDAHFPNAGSITEYGCGVGRNLLRLKQRFPKLQIYGYELARAGVEIAQDAAKKFGLEAKYAMLDYVNGRPEDFVFPKTDLALTVFSLEQLPYTNMIALKNMLDRAKLGTVHLEPVSENYPLSYRGLLGRVFTQRVDYLKNFDAGVHALPLKAVHKKVLSSAHNPLMYPTLYVLER
jgi:hypothetical protein